MALAAAGCVAAAAILVALYESARLRGLEAYCRNNLRQLGSLAVRNREQLDPGRTGRDFWQAVREAQYRDIRGEWHPISPDPFVCPVLGTTVSNRTDPRTIDYRGPVRVREQLLEIPKGEPLGADRPGNHPSGGFVLRLDTSVEDVVRVDGALPGDPLWSEAARHLKD